MVLHTLKQTELFATELLGTKCVHETDFFGRIQVTECGTGSVGVPQGPEGGAGHFQGTPVFRARNQHVDTILCSEHARHHVCQQQA